MKRKIMTLVVVLMGLAITVLTFSCNNSEPYEQEIVQAQPIVTVPEGYEVIDDGGSIYSVVWTKKGNKLESICQLNY